MRRFVLLVGIFLMMALTSLPETVMAQTPEPSDPCAAPNYRTDVRPGPKGQRTEVKLGARVVDLLEINDVDQTITLDVALRMQWHDPRLASLAGCKLPIRDIWFPQLIMKNSGRMFHRWPEEASVEENGHVSYLQRVSGTFAGYQQLKDFPFDHQVISLRLYPLDWTAEKLVLVNDQEFTGLADELNISDWQIKGVTADVIQYHFDSTDQVHSGYLLEISAKRHVSYYIWKVMVPIALIVVMSWCVFWINPKDFGTQLGFSASSVLTMIAFIFATTSLLPKLGYFTMLDRFVGTATIFVFLALLQSLITGHLATKGMNALAMRIDLISRFVFPMVFFGLCAILYINLN